MTREKTQKGNPHKLTRQQHVFPARSIERFAGNTGLVEVRRKGVAKLLALGPANPMFCANRAWDQRAEHGYMKRIEDRFQDLANRVVVGQASLDQEEYEAVAEFCVLWQVRSRRRANPLQVQAMRGILAPQISQDKQEILESNGYVFALPEGVPGRFMAGITMQFHIDQICSPIRGQRWGIVRAADGEFILPDTFGQLAIVPVTPTISLIHQAADTTIGGWDVARINRLAIANSAEYRIARKFSDCPL